MTKIKYSFQYFKSLIHNEQSKVAGVFRSLATKRSALLIGYCVFPAVALAADFEGTLKNLVSSVTSRILPIFALYFLAKNIMAHIQGDPNARTETIRVVIGIVCLLGITGVWSYINQQIR